MSDLKQIQDNFDKVAKMKEHVENSSPLSLALDLCEKDREIQIYKKALKISSEIAMTQEIDEEDMYSTIREYMPENELGITKVGIINYSLSQAKKELGYE